MPFRYNLQKILNFRITKRDEQIEIVKKAQMEVDRIIQEIAQKFQEVASVQADMKKSPPQTYDMYDKFIKHLYTQIAELEVKKQEAEQKANEIKESDDDTKKMVDSLEALAKVEAFEVISDAAKEMLDALIECAETAEKFEDAMAKVQSIAQVSSGELDAMATDIRRVAMEMGYGTGEVAEATYQAEAFADFLQANSDLADNDSFKKYFFSSTLILSRNFFLFDSNGNLVCAPDVIDTSSLNIEHFTKAISYVQNSMLEKVASAGSTRQIIDVGKVFDKILIVQKSIDWGGETYYLISVSTVKDDGETIDAFVNKKFVFCITNPLNILL